MKLSDLLAEHPQLDADLGDVSDRIFLDGIYLFRVLDANDDPGDSVVYIERSPHTDNVIRRGLIQSAQEIDQAQWPVHVCPGDEHHDG